jgi:hypothetical protein
MKVSLEQEEEKSRSYAARNGGTEKRCIYIRWFFRFLTAILGLAQIVLARNTVGPDVRSYLEMARAILRHDWPMVTNAYWSVLYPWLLAPLLAIFRPSLRWEFPVAHALAFPILLLCIAAFEFFWLSVLRLRGSLANKCGSASAIPTWQFWVLGYSFFIWLVVGDLITAINPDLSMTATALFSAGLLNRIVMAPNARRKMYVWFGFSLGVGYLVKAVLFPMAFVFLGVAILVSRRSFRARRKQFALVGLIFAVLVLPEVVLLSHAKHRLTFSDAGRLNFAWFTYHLPLRNWQGEPRWSGTPLHPTRRIFDHPAIYEFNGPLRSSYPPWYDPSYWNDGMSPKMRPRIIARHVLTELAALVEILRHPTAWIVGILLILLSCDPRPTMRGVAASWYLLAIVAIAFALHCLTLVESRYLGPWEILLWGAILSGVQLRRGMERWCKAVTALVSLAMIIAIVHLEYGESIHGFHNYAGAEYVTAEGLRQMGLQAGTNVAAIGFDNDAYWAYLLRLNIVAEINTDETCLFWSEPAEVQQEVMRKFSQVGADVVVVNTGGGIRTTSRAIPLDLASCAHPGTGWRKIPGSPDYAFFCERDH